MFLVAVLVLSLCFCNPEVRLIYTNTQIFLNLDNFMLK